MGEQIYLIGIQNFESLLLSTLKVYFLGKRELFGGLAVEGLEEEWKEHPVLHEKDNPRSSA